LLVHVFFSYQVGAAVRVIVVVMVTVLTGAAAPPAKYPIMIPIIRRITAIAAQAVEESALR